MAHRLLCGICRVRPAKARGRCSADLEYLRRHGHDAPVRVTERRGPPKR